jgi:creatinine amidohydrolase
MTSGAYGVAGRAARGDVERPRSAIGESGGTVPTTHRLEQLAWPEVRDAIQRNLVVILPLGAIEQHGPHLPIDTDAYLAHELALASAQGRPVLVAPPITYGCRSRPQSGGGEEFPGTLSLAGNTFVSVVSEVLGGLLRAGFRQIVVFSWHMENRGFAYEAAYAATAQHRDGRVAVMEAPFDALSDETMTALFPEGFPGWSLEHAGVLETSLMLFLRPSVVRAGDPRGDRIVVRPYDVLPEAPLGPGQTGVLWDAKAASPEAGRLAHNEIVANVRGVLDEVFGART